MSSWKQQALIEAPVEEVWGVISNPETFPEWSENSVEVTGVLTKVEKGSTYRETSRGPFGKVTTTFEVEELDDLREIKLRCQTSGYYSHWLLTEAQGNTFAEVELGIEPPSLPAQVFRVTHNKRFLRRMAEGAVDGLRRFLGSRAASRSGS